MEALLRALVATEPMATVHGYHDHEDFRECVYCHTETHSDDCPWLQASLWVRSVSLAEMHGIGG